MKIRKLFDLMCFCIDIGGRAVGTLHAPYTIHSLIIHSIISLNTVDSAELNVSDFITTMYMYKE